MIEVISGQLRFTFASFDQRLAVAWRDGGRWLPIELRKEGDGFVGTDGPVEVRLRLNGAREGVRYSASFTSTYPTRIKLALLLPSASEPFHVIPGFLFGDNNLGHVAPGKLPCLTQQTDRHETCARYWECRADRASHPASAALWAGAAAAMSIDPYSLGQANVGHGGDNGFIRNGLFAQLEGDGQPAACGVTIGYGNLPKTFVNAENFAPATAHFSRGAEASGTIFLRPANDRRALHGIYRDLYDNLRNTPKPPISRDEAARDLTRAFHEVNWHGEDGFNLPRISSGTGSPYFGGKQWRSNFTNMRLAAEQKAKLVVWRTLAEVGWSGGAVIGYPLLLAGAAFGDELSKQRGVYKLDCVADGINPATGLLFEVSGVNEGKRLNWWWSAPPLMDCHFAYTQGSACYYLLKSARFVRNSGAGVFPNADVATWERTALRVLDTAMTLQLKHGGFGYAYHGDRPAMLDEDGFAGAWFIPGLALAYSLTRDPRYLNSAVRALDHYHAFVRDLNCWGTPLDSHKFVDQEGNLGFTRGAQLLHEATGDGRFLAAAIDGAHYEYLWRYAYRTRPQHKPLLGSPWNSCGGSFSSTAGCSLHPMGVFIAAQLYDLSKKTGDDYHARRADDSLNWAANSVALYPDYTGYGQRGVMSERFCPSDGMTIELHPDGTPSSMGLTYNGWAGAACLEGLLESR